MDNQVSCTVSGPSCRYPAQSGRFGTVHFVLDWLAWFCVAGSVAIAGCAVRAWRGRRAAFATR